MKNIELFQDFADGYLDDAKSGNAYFVGNDLYIKSVKICKVDRSAKTFEFFNLNTIAKETYYAIYFALVEVGFKISTKP